jgi:hypothetical protein
MTPIEMRTRVGPDGVLALSVPIGMSVANREVKVVVELVEPAVQKTSEMRHEEWQRFIAETAGRWRGDLERPEQGPYETRDEWP